MIVTVATFVCTGCGHTFDRVRTDEDVAGEAAAVFTSGELADVATVCDDCWRAMREAMPDLDARYRGAGL